MPVNLSVKNVPDGLADKLRERARRNHRSLQGELMAILEEAARGKGSLPFAEADALLKRLDVRTSGDSTVIVREMRDARPGG
jgi:plasmid stability protein